MLGEGEGRRAGAKEERSEATATEKKTEERSSNYLARSSFPLATPAGAGWHGLSLKMDPGKSTKNPRTRQH